MTVGQRIARKRKELGLSQEALGERLGVSRQAIYKWESDAALPEVEKLVKLGREFSVPVGWLLGEEDDTPEKPELTPEQLRMVEEIVGRYLAAQPRTEPRPEGPAEPAEEGPEPEKPKKRRRWPVVVAGAAVIVLIGVFSNLFSRLDQLYRDTQNLQMNMGEISYNVDSQINGITRRVEEVLQSQNRLTAEQSAEVAATDYRANTVTVSARALPRTYVEGMTAEFILVSGGESVTVPGVLGDDHAFTAEVTGPLSDDISVSVVFLTGDQRETQLIEQFTYLYSSSFPELSVIGDLWGSSAEIGKYMDIRIDAEVAARLTSLRLGLFRDKKLLAWYEPMEGIPPNWSGFSEDEFQFFRLEGDWTMEPGHEYCQAAVLVDEYGRERVYPSLAVVYDPEEGFANFVDSEYRLYGDSGEWEY